MANNYSQQPPYGIPGLNYHMPPPQHPAPSPQGDAQAGPSDPRQAQQMWNWQAYLQNAQQPSQQPSFPFWPPPPAQQQNDYAPLPFPPPPFPAQNGFVPPPPPPGSNFFPPPPMPEGHLQAAPSPMSAFMTPPTYSFQPPVPAVPPTYAAQQPMPAASDRVAEVMDGDKEDGEVSDGDRVSRSPAGFSKPIPEPPRSVPQIQQEPRRNESRDDGRQSFGGPSQSSHSQAHSTADRMRSSFSVPQTKQTITPPTPLDSLLQKREEGYQFVKFIHDHHYGFSTLVKDFEQDADAQALRDLYRSRNLPVPPERFLAPPNVPAPAPTPTPAPKPSAPAPSAAQAQNKAPVQPQKVAPVPESKVNSGLASTMIYGASAIRTPGPAAVDATQKPQAKPAPAVKTNLTQAPPAKAAASPIDRKDYIARLQAAKMAKQSAGAKVTPPQKTPPPKAASENDPVSTATVHTPQAAPAINGNTGPKIKPPVTEEEKARKTEMIRQRLEAMKAKQAASSPATPQASKLTASVSSTIAASSSTLQNAANMQTPTPQPPRSAQSMATAQSPQSFQAPAFSGIPGLFMSASSGPTTSAAIRPMQSPQVRSSPIPPQINTAPTAQRRMVASDFEEVTTPQSYVPTYTRPLGQSPHEHDGESMIIEVSEDESAGSEMDLDDDQPISKPAVMSSADSNHNGQHQLRNLPPLSDFPSRPTSVKPVSSAVSTPGPQTPATVVRNAELQKKERDLAVLKESLQRKLREHRQKQEQLAAATSSPKPPTSSSQTPSKQTNLGASLPPPFPKTPLSNPPSQTFSPATASSFNTQAVANESKKRRRAEIESGLPTLEAEIAHNTARMAQIAKEMEELRVNNERISQDKERLIKELESLGIDTEGMPHAELQAKKDEIESGTLVNGNATDPIAQPQPPVGAREASENLSALEVTTAQLENQIDIVSDNTKVSPQSTDPRNPEELVPVSESDTVTTAPLPTEVQPEVADPIAEDINIEPASKVNGVRSPRSPSTGAVPLPENQEAPESIPPPNTMASSNDTSTPVDDEEDFYSPEPTVTLTLGDGTAVDTALEPAVSSLSEEEGEVEMSESSSSEDEDEYEPEEIQIELPTSLNSAARSEDTEALPEPAVAMPSDDEEMYEPPGPELGEEGIDPQPEPTNVASTSNIIPVEEDGAMDISTSSSDNSDNSEDSDSAPQSPSLHAISDSISFNKVPDSFISLTDNSTPKPHLEIVSAAQTAATEPISAPDDTVEPTSFVPYESPLRMFKSYRYHPSFSQDVPGGFLSMTYSHQIDPEKPLCQNEAVGDTCNDPACTDQHFRGMNITGEKLLVQLGTANPGKTSEEKQLWIDGLRGVLKELRQKNIQDPNGIAAEIAKYRRQFLNDDTRVVNL